MVSTLMPKQLPLKFKAEHKTDVRTQFAALCFRIVNDVCQVLLVTSRGSGRWIIPKGWPISKMKPGDAALQEAWEEAGVKGKAFQTCLGLYSYQKEMDGTEDFPCIAMVYPVKVKSLALKYPEKGQRKRKWFSLKKAAKKVDERELQQIIKSFDPKLLK